MERERMKIDRSLSDGCLYDRCFAARAGLAHFHVQSRKHEHKTYLADAFADQRFGHRFRNVTKLIPPFSILAFIFIQGSRPEIEAAAAISSCRSSLFF
mmetsp:Transcript_4184/g.8334  ORF Transcript_4184/g.8334 Transcript_4184/m.8334 type:complete len:98 (+) Transcript_4184:877-1170(+)